MEKFLDYIDLSKEYKILLKSDNIPLFGFITDIDSHFLYLEFPDKTPLFISLDDIRNIIPSKGGRR